MALRFTEVDAVFGPYVKGKQRAEAAVKAKFSDSSLVLQPSFIYGGDEFSATPPRVAGWYGEKDTCLRFHALFLSPQCPKSCNLNLKAPKLYILSSSESEVKTDPGGLYVTPKPRMGFSES